MFARFSDKVAAQLAAQSTALTAIMQRFETLHPSTPPSRLRRPDRQPISASRSPSRRTSPSPQRSPNRQSALDANAFQGVSSPSTRARSLVTLARRRTSWHSLRASRLLCRWVRLSSRTNWLLPHSLVSCARDPHCSNRSCRAHRSSLRRSRSRRIPQRAHSRGICLRSSLSRRCPSHRISRIYSTFYSNHRAHRASRLVWWCRLSCNRAPHRR